MAAAAAMSVPEVETSDHSFNKEKMLMKWIKLEEKATGGDDFLFWKEANAIDSTQRINALDAKLCEFHGDCGKFAVDWCVNKGVFDSSAGNNALLAKIGLFTEECGVLFEEYLRSAAELCIKKMRLGALMEWDKQRMLKHVTVLAKKAWEDSWIKFTAFKNNLLEMQDSHTHVIVQENDVGGAPDKSPEIAGGKIKNLESALSNVKLGSTCNFRAVGIRRESSRVMVEMMRGVNKVGGQQPVPGLDDAVTMGKEWGDAVVGKCIYKIWVGTMIDRHSLFEVLKREIEENWKMEKKVKRRIVMFQRNHARLSQGSVTKVGPKPHVEGAETVKEKNIGVAAVVRGDETIEVKKSEVVTVVEGDEAIKEKKIGVETVVEGEETIEVKKSEVVTVVECDEAIKEKKIGVETVVEGEETVQEKKSEGVAVVEGGDKIEVD